MQSQEQLYPKPNYDWQNTPINTYYVPTKSTEFPTDHIFYTLLRITKFPSMSIDYINTIFNTLTIHFDKSIDEKSFNEEDEFIENFDLLEKYISDCLKNTENFINDCIEDNKLYRKELNRETINDITESYYQTSDERNMAIIKYTRLLLVSNLHIDNILLRNFVGLFVKSSDIIFYKDNIYNRINLSFSDNSKLNYNINNMFKNYGLYRLVLSNVGTDLSTNIGYTIKILLQINKNTFADYTRLIKNNVIVDPIINICYYDTSINTFDIYANISTFNNYSFYIYNIPFDYNNIVYIGNSLYYKTILENNYNNKNIILHNSTIEYLDDYNIIYNGNTIEILCKLKNDNINNIQFIYFYLDNDFTGINFKLQLFPINKISGNSVMSSIYDSTASPLDFLSSSEIGPSAGYN